MNIQAVVSQNMRHYRKRARLTQEELAEKSGLHRTYIGGIEQRRINASMRNLERIAAALGIDPMQLFQEPRSPSAAARQKVTLKRTTSPGKGLEYWLLPWDEERSEPTEHGHKLNVLDENLTIQILCALVEHGYSGDALAKRYEEVHREIMEMVGGDGEEGLGAKTDSAG